MHSLKSFDGCCRLTFIVSLPIYRNYFFNWLTDAEEVNFNELSVISQELL